MALFLSLGPLLARMHSAVCGRSARAASTATNGSSSSSSGGSGASSSGFSYEQLRQWWEQHTRSLYTFFAQPLLVARATGAVLTDHTGRSYLDFYNNVHCLGHGDERVVKAVTEQMRLNTLSTRYLNYATPEYIHALVERMPPSPTGKGWTVFLVNSGSEANDLAFQIARDYTKKQGLIALEHCYHGITSAINEINDSTSTGVTGHHDVAALYTRQRIGIARFPTSVAQGVEAVKEQIEVLSSRKGVGVAGFIAETLQGVAGNVELPAGFFKAVYEVVHNAGGVVIADEVQTGFGRCGTFFAFEHEGVVPDMVTMGKPMGNGFPLGALICRTELAESIADAKFFSTYGGNPPAAAAGLAVLRAIDEDGLVEKTRANGAYLRSKLEAVIRQRPKSLSHVSGRGLFLGLHLVVSPNQKKHPHIKELLEECKSRGLVTGKGGVHANVLRLKPPLCVTRADIDKAVDILVAALNAVGLHD